MSESLTNYIIVKTATVTLTSNFGFENQGIVRMSAWKNANLAAKRTRGDRR